MAKQKPERLPKTKYSLSPLDFHSNQKYNFIKLTARKLPGYFFALTFMKKLLLVRHAKSNWNDPKLSDFDRPLNSRGNKNAPEMAERLLKKHIVPEHIVSSPAKRAFSTAKYFAKTFNIDKDQIEKIEGIYEASANELLKIVNQLSNSKNFVALFGHNPGITTLAVALSGSYISNIPTCGMVLIEFPFDDWAMISYDTGKEIFYDYPKNGDD